MSIIYIIYNYFSGPLLGCDGTDSGGWSAERDSSIILLYIRMLSVTLKIPLGEAH